MREKLKEKEFGVEKLQNEETNRRGYLKEVGPRGDMEENTHVRVPFKTPKHVD